MKARQFRVPLRRYSVKRRRLSSSSSVSYSDLRGSSNASMAPDVQRPGPTAAIDPFSFVASPERVTQSMKAGAGSEVRKTAMAKQEKKATEKKAKKNRATNKKPTSKESVPREKPTVSANDRAAALRMLLRHRFDREKSRITWMAELKVETELCGDECLSELSPHSP